MIIEIAGFLMAVVAIIHFVQDTKQTDAFIEAFRNHSAMWNKIYEMKCDPNTSDTDLIALLPAAELCDRIYERELRRAKLEGPSNSLVVGIVKWVTPETI